MRRRISVADVAVEVDSFGLEYEGAVDAMFGMCPTSEDAPTIRVERSKLRLEAPRRPPDLAAGDVEKWFEPDGAVARDASGAIGRRRGSDVAVWMPRDLGIADRAFRLAVQHPLVDALSQTGRFPVHGAVLVDDGQALIAAGPSGAGKSTFAAAALASGWLVLGDDLAFVGDDLADDVRVWSLPKPLSVPSDALPRVPSDARRLRDDARRRWALPSTGRLAPGSARLACIVIIQHSDGVASWNRLGGSVARLKQFAGSLGVGRLSGDPRAALRLAGKMTRLPTYEYRHDSDPTKRADAVSSFLAEVLPELDASSPIVQ